MKVPWLPFVLVACYAPRVQTGIPCAPDGDCPSGQDCDHGVCVETILDASIDAIVPDASVDGTSGLGPWGTPTPVVLSTTGADDDPTLTGDLLEMIFERNGDLYVVSRTSMTGAWSAPALIVELSSLSGETTCEMTSDGLTIYFASNRSGAIKIWTSTRPSRASVWGAPNLVPELNSTASDAAGGPSNDGLSISISSNRAGSYDIYTSTRASVSDAWSTPVAVAAVNSSVQDESPYFSDALTLYFDSDVSGNFEIYSSRRATATTPFQSPQPIAELSTTFIEQDPWVSPDGHHMFFVSNRGGTSALWYATR